MRISRVDGYSVATTHRAAGSRGSSHNSPTDSVRLSENQSKTHGRSFWSLIGGLFGGGGPAVMEAAAQAEDLVQSGAEFRRQGWALSWGGGKSVWREATPREVGKALADPERPLEARLPGSDWMPVESAQDLKELKAFHEGDPKLADAELARSVLGLSQDGVHFTVTAYDLDGSTQTRAGGAYAAYNVLGGESKGLSRLKADDALLSDAEAVHFLAAQKGVRDVGILARPEHGASILEASEAGFTFSSGSALESYQKLPRLRQVEISNEHVTLMEAAPAEFDKPEQLAKSLAEQQERYQSLAERLPREGADKAWRLLQERPSQRPFKERAELVVELLEADPKTEQLYGAVLDSAAPQEPLSQAGRLAVEVLKRLPEESVEAYRDLRGLSQKEQQRYLEILPAVKEPSFTRRSMQLLGQGSDSRFKSRQRALVDLAEKIEAEQALDLAEKMGSRIASECPLVMGLVDHAEGDLDKVHQAVDHLLGKSKPKARLKAFMNLGDFDEGLKVARALQGELLERGEALERTAEILGGDRDAALEIWNQLGGAPDFGNLERAQALAGGPEEVHSIYTSLGKMKLDQEGLQLLTELVRPVHWEAEGSWGRTEWEGRRVWADSPGRNYSDRRDSRLTSGPVDLSGVKRPSLSFESAHRTENSHDWIKVQVRSQGGEWEELDNFTGQGEWSKKSYDLSAYQGKKVEVAFQFHSDGSNTDEGFHFNHLSLGGVDDQGLPKVLAQEIDAPPNLAVVAEMLGDDPTYNLESLKSLSRLTGACGNLDDGLGLWAQLEPGPDWDLQVEAMSRLASTHGRKRAEALWPDLKQLPGSLLENAEKAHRYGLLVESLGVKDEQATDLAARLLVARLSPQAVESCHQLSSEKFSPQWEVEGEWRRDTQQEEAVWTQGVYKDNMNQSLTSPGFSLDEPVEFLFSARYKTEATHDHCFLEWQVEGEEEWRQLEDFNGESNWQSHRVEIPALKGRRGRLRFRFQTDGSNNSEGVFLKGLTLRDPSGVIWSEEARMREVVEAGLASPIPGEALVALSDSAQRLGPGGALAMWQVLGDEVGHQDFEQKRHAFVELTNEVGIEQAGRVWPALVSWQGGSLEQQVKRATALHQAAQAFAGAPEQEALWNEFLDSELNLEAAETLAQLPRLDQAFGWSAEGSWGTTQVEGRQGVWADSPAGNYSDNQETALTSTLLSLEDLAGTRLSFEADYEFEDTHDNCFFEVREEGGEWEQLETFNGKSPGWERHLYDLSDYDGKNVQLRFRLKTDGSQTRRGIHLDKIRLGGLNQDGSTRTVAHSGRSQHTGSDLLKLADYSGDTPEQKSRIAVSLAQVAQMTGSLDEANRLWPALAPHFGENNFADRCRALGSLAARAGTDQALDVWPEIAGPDMEGKAGRAVSLYDLASMLSAVGTKSPDPELQAVLWRKMVASDLNFKAASALADLADRQSHSVVRTGGTWAKVDRPDGTVWEDSPGGNYSDKSDSSLEFDFDLTHHQGCRLGFSSATDTEERHDVFSVEMKAEADTEWTELLNLSGKNPRRRHEFDVSEFDGKKAQLRFRLKTDGSQVAQGVEVGTVFLSGLDTAGQPQVLSGEWSHRAIERLLDGAAGNDDLVRLAEIAGRLGSLDETVRLRQGLPAVKGTELEAAARMAARIGVTATVALWDELPKQPSETLEQRADTMARAWLAASGGFSETVIDEESQLELFRALHRRPQLREDEAGCRAVSRLAQNAPSALFSAEGGWTYVGEGLWQDSPEGPYQDNTDISLTVTDLDLSRLSRPQLDFWLEHQLEDTHDKLLVEALGADGSWSEVTSFTGSGAGSMRSVELGGSSRGIRFRLQTDSSKTLEGVSLKDVSISGRKPGASEAITVFDSNDHMAGLRPLIKMLDAGDLDGETLVSLADLPGDTAHKILRYFSGHQAGGGRARGIQNAIQRVLEASLVAQDLTPERLEELLRSAGAIDIETTDESIIVGDFEVAIQD